MELFSNFNGKIVKNSEICLSADNRSFKYGDGCFETMKVVAGCLVLEDLHVQRFFSSLHALQFLIPSFFTADYLTTQILTLVRKNGHEKMARVRLVAYRGNGGLYEIEDHTIQFIIQCNAGNVESNCFNQIGLNVDVFGDAKKTADKFSCIKSNNYLGYAMAAIWAKSKGLNDALITNAFGRIAEATIANIFIVSAGIIKTPALTEGCISGVMRKYLLDRLKKDGFSFVETEITVAELFQASEVFLTNAGYGIRWVEKVGENMYHHSTSSLLHHQYIAPLYTATTF